MDLREYLLLILRRWPSFVIAFSVVVGAVVGASLLMAPTYSASATLYVSADPARVETTRGAGAESESVLSAQERGDQIVAGRLKSYAVAINSEAVLLAVIDDLDLDESFASLNRRVSAEVVSESYLLKVTVTDETAAGAADIANAVTANLPAAVATLDGASSPQASLTQFGVLQRALPPQYRISPNLKLNTAVALLLGLFVGALAAVLTETFDNRLRRGTQVTTNGVRYLGAVPVLKERARATLLVPDEQAPELRDFFTRLAVDVRNASGPGQLRILLTSPRAGAGTTSVAVNLASRLAAGGEQVLYIDTDSSERSFTTLTGLGGDPGLSDVIAGSADLDSALAFWQPGGFTVLPHGTTVMNASDMLGGASFRRMLTTADQIFDVVVFDAPTIMHSPEAGLLAREVSRALVVAEAGSTRRSEFRATAEAVRRAGVEIVGSVLMRGTRSTAIATAAEVSDETTERVS